MEESKHIEIKENADSITYGSATKGGEIKVYGDFNDPDTFKKKIDKAIEVRKHTQEQLGGL